jgi:hypothetical protein
MKRDDEIDRLYQLPLKEFTPARNALAKQRSGDDANSVRELQKPNAAAWGVNQLYWRDRNAYEALVNASEALRKAHRALLGGKAVDLREVETVHRDAVRTAVQKIRDLLKSSDESDSDATMTAVSETLEALPADEEPGRLTRPLKRMGFEVLSGVSPRPATAAPRKLSLVSSRDKKAVPQKPELSPATQREIDELDKRLRTAQFEERQLQSDIERGRREVDRAEREHARVEQELAEVAEKLARHQADLASKEKSKKAIEAEQAKLEQRLARLRNEA